MTDDDEVFTGFEMPQTVADTLSEIGKALLAAQSDMGKLHGFVQARLSPEDFNQFMKLWQNSYNGLVEADNLTGYAQNILIEQEPKP